MPTVKSPDACVLTTHDNSSTFLEHGPSATETRPVKCRSRQIECVASREATKFGSCSRRCASIEDSHSSGTSGEWRLFPSGPPLPISRRTTGPTRLVSAISKTSRRSSMCRDISAWCSSNVPLRMRSSDESTASTKRRHETSLPDGAALFRLVPVDEGRTQNTPPIPPTPYLLNLLRCKDDVVPMFEIYHNPRGRPPDRR